MSIFEMYLLVKLDDFGEMLELFSVITFVAAIIFAVAGAVQMDDRKMKKKTYFSWLIPLTVIFVMSLGLMAAVPSTKQMAAILIIPAITDTVAENKKLRQLPDKLLDLAGDWIDELSPEKEEVKPKE